MDVLEKIKDQVESNPVIIYMKGTPGMPMCGFSSRTVDALKQCEREFAYVNVIADPEIFENLPRFADWVRYHARDARLRRAQGAGAGNRGQSRLTR